MEQSSLISKGEHNYPWYVYLIRMIAHPIQAGREIAGWHSVWPGLVIGLTLAVYMTLACFISHLNHDYPPPAEELRVWIETWGEFTMLPLPFLGIPLEKYRLFMALISLPVVLGSWCLMASTAHFLAHLFGARTTFRQYLNLFAFSFFPFWFLAVLGDGLFNTLVGASLIPGLQGAYGPAVQAFFKNYPPLLYTLLFSLGAVYNALAAYSAAHTKRGWQVGLTGFTTFIPPMLLSALLFR